MRKLLLVISAVLLIVGCQSPPSVERAPGSPPAATPVSSMETRVPAVTNSAKPPVAMDAGALPTSDVSTQSDLITPPTTPNLTQYVDPFIGTAPSAIPSLDPVPGGSGGSTVPGPSVPFGMVQWSPDTLEAEPSGYSYTSSTIKGFSLTHFDGTGCANNMDFPILPIIGPLKLSPGSAEGTDWSTYGSSFSHGAESASPGHYQVRLDKHGIQVDLTATTRTGLGRFSFPPSQDAAVLITPGYTTMRPQEAQLSIEGSDQLSGIVVSGNFCGLDKWHRVFFFAQFDRPFTHFGIWNQDRLMPGSRNTSVRDGALTGAYLTFDTTQTTVVSMKVGLSYVSIANARENLERENPGWDFSVVQDRARAAWQELLSRVEIEGGTVADKRVFYTALYHAFLHPNVFSDVNGQYIGFDDQIHTGDGYIQYANYSGWDIYRCWAQLAALLAPLQANDMIQSLVVDAEQGKGGLPKWPHANTETGIMVGDPGALIVANAYAFGARNFDAGAALAAMDRGASQPGTGLKGVEIRPRLADYLRYGYIPAEEDTHHQPAGDWGPAATTLEYANADFAIAQFARALGNRDKYQIYLGRAQNWQNLFDASSRLIRPRLADGSWMSNFDPAQEPGFVEGNATQYTWLVPFDLPTLFDRMGGKANALQQLDALFEQLNAGMHRPYFYMGDEPGFATPWIYDFAGSPWKTQRIVRRITNELFTPAPGGLPGNDDMGAMSAWYVWAALGLYPEIPGTDVLVIGSPRFPSATLRLGTGKLLHIEAPGAVADMPYVESLRVNGHLSTRPWLRLTEIANGGALEFELGPNTVTPDWGSDPSDAPPTFFDTAPARIK